MALTKKALEAFTNMLDDSKFEEDPIFKVLSDNEAFQKMRQDALNAENVALREQASKKQPLGQVMVYKCPYAPCTVNGTYEGILKHLKEECQYIGKANRLFVKIANAWDKPRSDEEIQKLVDEYTDERHRVKINDKIENLSFGGNDL